MVQDYLTGKVRHRAKPRMFRAPILVLQVEVCRPAHVRHNEDYDPYGCYFGYDETVAECKWWRDATVEDLAELTSYTDKVEA